MHSASSVNNDLISDHDDPNKDSGQEEGAESGNGTHLVPHKLVDEEDSEHDCYFLHTSGQDYDHQHGLKFKCSLCNIFYLLLLQKGTVLFPVLFINHLIWHLVSTISRLCPFPLTTVSVWIIMIRD